MKASGKSTKRATRCLSCILALLLVCAVLLSLASCKKGSDQPLSPGLSMIEGEPVYDESVALRTDHFTVTPGMMAFFFYDYGGTLMSHMEQYKAYDSALSLHDQIYADGLSWYEYIMDATLKKVSEMLIYCEAAYDAGVELSQEQEDAVENKITAMRLDAAALYSLDLEAYLHALYGPLITQEDLRAVYEAEALAAVYSETVTAELEGDITDSEIRDYADANDLKDGTPSRNLVYMTIPYVNGAANEEQVNAVLEALKKNPEAETFSAFSDAGTVGEEKNMTPDNTGVAAIADWLFDAKRRVGDSGSVEYGNYTYVLLYTDNGMSYAHVSARMSLYDIAYAEWYNAWVERLTFGYNYDVLDSYDVN